jgi:hypothetical protein
MDANPAEMEKNGNSVWLDPEESQTETEQSPYLKKSLWDKTTVAELIA